MNALTKSFKSASGVLLLSGVAAASLLSSCANENIFSSENGKTVNITVNVVKPGFDDNTRTSLTENKGNLDCFWKSGDQIWVTNQDGGSVGYLTMMPEYDGKVNAKFTGSLTGMKDGKTTLKFYYLGTEKNAQAASGKQEFSFAKQEGTIPSLSYNDLLMSEREVNVADGDAYTEELGLQRQFAFARFRLVMPAGVEVAGQTVTVSGENFFNVATLDPAGSITFTAGSATVKINSDNEFYMTILPETGKQITPTFTVTVGEKTYIGSLSAREWKKSEYVRMDLGNGSYQGIPIDMTEKQGGDNEFDDPYPDEDPNNPLHIFAKGNLTRNGDVTNKFAPEGDNGALYQWGRNHGYIDTKGIYENSKTPAGTSWGVGNDFINFLDAMGGIDYTETDNLYGILDYFVYNPTFSAYYGNKAITSGTALHFNSSYLRFYDMPKIYNTVDFIKNNPTKYFMDGRAGEKLRGYGTYYAGVDEMNNNPDYWVSDFGDGGNTWTARALACGYESGNPCPEGWRLPTEAEMRAIAPEGKGLDSSKGYLSSMLSGYSELRQTPAGIRYAIRWLYNRNAITIEAVVVDESYTDKSQLTTLFWDQNSSKKVVREFPFTGVIRPFIGNSAGYSLDPTWICRPLHNGLAALDFMPTNLPYYVYGPDLYTLMGPADEGGLNPSFGCYWVEEKGKAFKFATRDIASSLAYSCLLVEDAEPVMGYAIRPVMDK